MTAAPVVLASPLPANLRRPVGIVVSPARCGYDTSMSDACPSKADVARWYLRGVGQIMSVPALVLLAAMVGFTALARDAGYELGEIVFLTVTVWALPSQVVFIGMVGSGGSVPAVILAVSLSAMRFLPMTMAWTPVVRDRRTPTVLLFVLSWFVAVTAWVFAMGRLPEVPRPVRLPYFAGFGTALVASSAGVITLSYVVLGDLGGFAAAALVFLTPVYFLIALWGAARVQADKVALGAGLVLGPLVTLVAPQADILIAGLVGGTIAWAGARFSASRRA